MFKILYVLKDETVQAVIKHLEAEVAPKLSADVSRYAPGRLRAWLPYEAPSSADRPWADGVTDERVWSWVQSTLNRHAFTAETCLISRGGGISRHRDAPYAQFRAMGINLGRVVFGYEPCYPGLSWVPGSPRSAEPQRHALLGGEIFEFNCKNPHWVQDADPDRWSINAWTISDKERKRFNLFQQRVLTPEV